MNHDMDPKGAPGEGPSGTPDMSLVLNIGVELTVELGRTQMPIRDVLALGPGALLALDTLAGEPVNLRVNGTLIARGDVVVVDGNYGVRVIELVQPAGQMQTP
jgi:flagellar motor switch protein FliN/FliY